MNTFLGNKLDHFFQHLKIVNIIHNLVISTALEVMKNVFAVLYVSLCYGPYTLL